MKADMSSTITKQQANGSKNFYDLWGFVGGTTLGYYPDMTEGIYTTDTQSYEQAMENVHQWYLNNTINEVTTDRIYKVLELGFGYGNLSNRFIQSKKTIWHGINNSPIQCDYAKKNYDLDQNPHKIFQMSWYDFPYEQHIGEYDFIVVRGCLEHYLPAEEAAKGNEHCRKVYAELFNKLLLCLNPSAKNDGAGKIIGGTIFMRNNWTDEQLRKIVDPKDAELFSDMYYFKKITRTFYGHYPCSEDEFFSALDENMQRCIIEDGTRDYYYTSLDWYKLTRKNLLKTILSHPKHLFSYLFHNKLKAFTYIKDLFFDGIWIWQFTPRHDWENFSDTPCRLYRFVFQQR